MVENMLALAQQTVAAGSNADSALPEALRVSGVALVAIFIVMGLFGSMIALLSRLFPEAIDESE
jgi:hypothetical protein